MAKSLIHKAKLRVTQYGKTVDDRTRTHPDSRYNPATLRQQRPRAYPAGPSPYPAVHPRPPSLSQPVPSMPEPEHEPVPRAKRDRYRAPLLSSSPLPRSDARRAAPVRARTVRRTVPACTHAIRACTHASTQESEAPRRHVGARGNARAALVGEGLARAIKISVLLCTRIQPSRVPALYEPVPCSAQRRTMGRRADWG